MIQSEIKDIVMLPVLTVVPVAENTRSIVAENTSSIAIETAMANEIPMVEMDAILEKVNELDDYQEFFSRLSHEMDNTPLPDNSHGIDTEQFSIDDKKGIIEIMESEGVEPIQDPIFWNLIRDVMNTSQPISWKSELITLICEGQFADYQGSDTMWLNKILEKANEKVLAQKVVQGVYDMPKIFYKHKASPW